MNLIAYCSEHCELHCTRTEKLYQQYRVRFNFPIVLMCYLTIDILTLDDDCVFGASGASMTLCPMD